MRQGKNPGMEIPRTDGAVTQHPWPEDCGIQGGLNGLVINRREPEKSYHTVFVEVFPSEPRTFIRGEGSTVAEAEDSCWAQYSRVRGCEEHEFETRGYRNGAGFCKHCGLFQSGVFDLKEIGSVCVVCGADYFVVRDGEMFCAEHAPDRDDVWWKSERG